MTTTPGQRLPVTLPIGALSLALAGGAWVSYGMGDAPESLVFLFAAVILLTCGCALLGQRRVQWHADAVTSIAAIGGLSLGSLLSAEPYNRVFLMGFFGYAVFTLTRRWSPSLRNTLAVAHLVLAMILSIGGGFLEGDASTVTTLFLALTLVPLLPFHLPFVNLLRSTHETSCSVWVVAWLALGCFQVRHLAVLDTHDGFGIVQVLALGSAVYASLKAWGHPSPRLSLAYATVALLALPWGLMTELRVSSPWMLSFGLTVGLLMSATMLSLAFLRNRYGERGRKSLQGLGAGLPRFRTLFTWLISLVMLLPIVPLLQGLPTMPIGGIPGGSLVLSSLLVLTVWFSTTWYFSNLLHQTAFGQVRTDIPYRDLATREWGPVILLIALAGYTGIRL